MEQSEWYGKRLGKFTASEIHRLLASSKTKGEIFGDGAMTYIREIIGELLTGQSSSDSVANVKSIDHGNAYEAEAFAAIVEKTGYAWEHFGGHNYKFVPFNAFSGGSPDCQSPEMVGEIKCPYNPANHVKFLMCKRAAQLKAASKEYYAQIQFNMMCTGKTMGLFSSYDPRVLRADLRLHTIYVPADAEMQKEIKFRLDEAAKIVKEVMKPYTLLVSPIPGGTLYEQG